jgi:hypothetical protein
MKASEWLMFCIEKRTSKKQKDIMLVKRINTSHEKRLVEAFREKEPNWFIEVALDTTHRHTLLFATDDYRGGIYWVEYSKKEKRFTHIRYTESGCWHYIPLKYCSYGHK